MKKYVLSLSFLAMTTLSVAQSGTNSPYSQYGLGVMADQSQGFSRGMNGVGVAFKEHNQVNYLNPASYASIDSLSFVFDAGMSLQVTNFSENGVRKNAKNGNVDYVVAGFRVMRHLGMSLGITPYSNVGYSFSQTSKTIDGYVMAPSTENNTTTTSSYTGDGGLRQVYLGLGWEPFKGFSIGGNVNYIWGDINRYTTNTFSDVSVKSLAKQYTAHITNVRFDIGAMYSLPVAKSDFVTLGVTYSPEANLKSDAMCRVISANSQTIVTDTLTFTANNAYYTPAELKVGLAYNHKNQWKVGLDYTLQKWSSLKSPVYGKLNGVDGYHMMTGYYNDRSKLNLGGEYCKNEYGRSVSDRMRYRFGVGYGTSFVKINGKDGPTEFSMSAGVGVPIINTYNNRSMLNVSVQYAHCGAKDLIKENTFRINIGLTFNERWFAKWKFE